MNRMDNETCGLLTKKGEFIPLKGVVVQGYIIGRSARVSLSQHFKNEESKALEAVYKFPLPENSSICGFRAEIDDKIIQGKVEERDQEIKLFKYMMKPYREGTVVISWMRNDPIFLPYQLVTLNLGVP